MKKMRYAICSAALLLASPWASAAYLDLTTFGRFSEGVASIDVAPNLAVITVATNSTSSNSGANIYFSLVENVTSFDYSLSGPGFYSVFATNSRSVNLGGATNGFETYTFTAPYSGYLAFQIQADGEGGRLSLRNIVGTAPLPVLAAVPEPESFALLVPGLCWVGAAARRRQKLRARCS